MDLIIEGDGHSAKQEITELLEWLQEARLKEVETLAQRKRPPTGGELGPELLAALHIALASPAIIALIGCIKAFIVARKPKMKITLKTKNGTVVIESENPPDTQELERIARNLLVR